MEHTRGEADDGESRGFGQSDLEKAEDAPQDGDDPQYPTPGRTWIIMSCLYLTMFLVALVSCLRPLLVSKS